MSNYNPDYRRDDRESPPYSRDNSPERPVQARGSPSGATLQPPGAKPAGLTVSPPSTSQTAYTPFYAGASPTATLPVSTKANASSPKSSGAYKAYRPPVQQAYSTDSVIPSQPHGPYTAYQPPKPVTSTQWPAVAPLRPHPQPSPVISPLVQPVNNADQRPISPPAQRLPSPLPTVPRPDPVDHRPSTADSYTTLPPHDNKGGSAAAYYAPSATDSVVSTPSTYERPVAFPEKPATHSAPVVSGPYTPQGGVYQQQPQQQKPPYGPPNPTGTPPDRNRVSNYGSPSSGPAPTQQNRPPQQQSNVSAATGYADSNYQPFGPPLQPQQPPQPQQPGQYTPTQQSGTYPPAQQSGAYPPTQQSGPYPPTQQPGAYPPTQQSGAYPPTQQSGAYPPTQQSGAYPPTQQPGAYPPTQQPTVYPPTQQTVGSPASPPQGQAYAVELPSSPGLPNHPPKPSKQLSFTLPPSDVYAERIANFMNMLEKEASLQPTAAPTLGRPEPEDLETRRHKVFRDWIISEAKLRGPKFATDLADDLDSLSFGNKRTSEQFTAKPRGGADIYGGPPANQAQTPVSQPANTQPPPPPPPPKVTMLDLSKLLPLIYPPPPSKVSAATRLAPFQKTFAAASNLAFIEKNRQTFVATQSDIERRIQAEIDEVRRRRGKRNPADAENVVREIRKREGLDAYERFDRDVVASTYGELMKTGEVIDTVKQGVEDFVRDSVNTLTSVELLEIISFLSAVQDLSTTVHNHMESLLTERSMKYMYSLTVPLYEANDAAEAKKIEAWNQSVVAGQVADNKTAEEKRVGSYTKFIIEICDQVIAREKEKAARLTAVLTDLVRAIDVGTRDGGRLEFLIPHGEDTRPFDLSEEGKLLWLRSKILTAALAIQASLDSQKALQKTKDVATRLAIKARYAAQEAEAVKQNPTNQQKNIDDINKLREAQAREIEALNKSEERESETRGIERGRFEATIRPAADTLKNRALAVGGERAQNWAKEGNQETLLGWA